VGDTFLDNCFFNKKASGTYQMTLEGARRRISVEANAKQFPYFQVFTPPHRESIALEPMTCNVDAFNNKNGLVTLASNETWEGKIEIAVDG
jgi:aldose 1-epimerase